MNPLIDLNIEKNILGCIIVDNEILIDILDKIKTDYFSCESNKVIFNKMVELQLDNQPIDLLTLYESLKSKKIPVNYIGGLADDVVSAKSAIHYVKILHDLYIKRQLIAWSHGVMERMESGDNVDILLGDMMDEAFSLSSSKENNVKSMNKIIKSAVSQIENAHNNKGIIGVSSGLVDVDKLLCGFKPKLYILAGRPGTGKTALANNIATNAGYDGKKILMFSLEMPEEEIGIRMLASEANIDTQQLENGMVKESEWGKLMTKCGLLSESNIFVDDSGSQTDLDIWTKAKRHKAKHGLDIIIVDYLQLVTSAKQVKSRQLEIGEISRNFKKISKDLDVPVLALAQLSRAPEQEKRKPRLSDLRESGDIEQDADVVMFLHHPYSIDQNKPENVMEAIFAKHRGGKKGYVELNWRPDITKFSNYMKDYA